MIDVLLPLQDQIALVLIGINIILTILLVIIYVRSYRTISSKVTLGLLFFSLAFLVENIMNFYFYSYLLMQAIFGITLFQLVVNFVEMIALALLLWVTWK